MVKLTVVLVGFGVVGQGLTEILARNRERLEESCGASFLLLGICDLVKGSLYDPEGLSLDQVLRAAASSGKIGHCTAAIKGLDAVEMIRQSNARVVVEATPTNIATGEPAMTHFKTALQAGKHLVTTNKGPTRRPSLFTRCLRWHARGMFSSSTRGRSWPALLS